MKRVTPQLGTHLRVSLTFEGQERKKSFHKLELTIGRANEVAKPDLDLSPDVNVSRRHARVWVEDGHCWIEDLGSKFGTHVDGEPVYPGLKASVKNESVIRIGDTNLCVECGAGEGELAGQAQAAAAFDITDSIDANANGFDLAKTASTEVMARQALLLELPFEFSAPVRLDDLAQTIVKRSVESIPGAKRSTLLLRRPESDTLVVAAFVSDTEPAVSESLVRRGLTEQKGYIWRRGGAAASGNGNRPRAESGMYVPLLCRGRALGALCVDNPHRDGAFSDDDLRLLLTIAHQAALSVANLQMHEESRENALAMERLLSAFSPKLRVRLLEHARQGRLRPGSEQGEVTVVHAQLRAVMPGRKGTGAVVFDLLNRTFSAFTDSIFSFDGVVLGMTSGSLLAVFGSPEPDAAQHAKAVRAAWELQRVVRELNARRAPSTEAVCELGIGIDCGDAVHGFVGSAERLTFQVAGIFLNDAAHLSNVAIAGEILVSNAVRERTAALIEAERISPATRPESNMCGYRVQALCS